MLVQVLMGLRVHSSNVGDEGLGVHLATVGPSTEDLYMVG